MGRSYTGFDGNSDGKLAGTEKFIDEFIKLTGGAFFNNGSWSVRPMRGSDKPSIHGTGRAVDFSYRGAPYKGCGDRKVAEKWIEWLADNADALGIELICDYMPRPFGRGWKCDRSAWRTYTRRTLGSAGGKSWADWIHVELNPTVARDAKHFEKVFALLSGEAPEVDVPEPYRGTPIRRGEADRELVKRIQRVVGAYVDGYFGPKTEKAVMRWQGRHNCYPDGWIGPQTWAAMEPFLQ